MVILIRASLFLGFWAVASTLFMGLGFHLFDNTQVSKSVSPVIMSLLMYAFAISSCLSSSYALMFRALPRYDSRSWYLLLVNAILSIFLGRTIDGIIFTSILGWIIKIWIKIAPFIGAFFIVLWISLCLWMLYISPKKMIGILIAFLLIFLLNLFMGFMGFPIKTRYEVSKADYSSINSSSSSSSSFFESVVQWVFICIISFLVLCIIINIVLEELRCRVAILIVLHSYLFFMSGENTNFSPILVLFISHFISALRVQSSMSKYPDDRSWIQKLVCVASKVKKVYSRFENKVGVFRTFLEIAIGLLGSILFQNFFKVTSFNEALAFVCFAAMWLANLTLLGNGGDFGVFFFLLFNMVVGSMQNEFALRRNTWLAYGFAIFLSGMRLSMKSVTVYYGIGQLVEIPFDCCFSTSTEDEGSVFMLEEGNVEV